MDINIKRREASLKETVCSKFVETKAECDLIVPDAKPDVSKVLQICPKAVIMQKNVQQDKAYIQGVVHLTVVYIPDGGGIKSIFTNLDFSSMIDIKGAEPSGHIWAEADLESIDYSIINSRKINIKCTVGIDAKISRKCNMNIPVGFEEGTSALAKYSPLKLSYSSPEEEQCFRFRESIEVPSGKPDICEILKADARLSFVDIKYDDGKINLGGDVDFSAVYLSDNESVCSLEETLPFSETLEGITLPEGNIEGCFSVCDIVFDTPEAMDGTRRVLNIDLLICAVFKVNETLEVDTICDAFSTHAPLTLSKNTYEIENLIDKNTVQVAHKESVSIPDYLPQIHHVCDLSGEARVTGISIENGKIHVEGEILSNIIYQSGDEDCQISGMSHISSFSQTVDMPDAKETSICEAKIELDNAGYNINSDRSLELRFIAILTISVLESRSVEIIDEIAEKTDAENTSFAPAIIYYADEGETVWDIAKHYMVAPDTIIANNQIDGDILHKGQKICIFK